MSGKLTAIVLLAWLALVGALVKGRYAPSATLDDESINISAVESDDWFTIRIRGSNAGFARSRQIKEGENWSLRDDLRISLNLQGRVKPVSIVNESLVDDQFKLISFNTKISSGIISFKMSGKVEGNTIILNAPSQGGGGQTKLRLGEVPRLARSLGLPVPITGLNVGDVIRLPVFDPMEGSKSESLIRVLEHANVIISGESFEAWRVKAEYRSMEIIMWVDEKGRLVKGIMPLGITVVRAPRSEIETSLAGGRDLPEMLAMTAAPVKGAIPDPRNLEELKLKLTASGSVNVPRDLPRQNVKDRIIILSKHPLPTPEYQLPYPGNDMDEYLKASRFITSDNERIIEKAREIVGAQKNPVKAAKMINQWVHGYLKKTPTPAVPNAYEALKSKYGDCNEHAVLAAALARAVGIPCRIAVGLMYMEDGFYYHAWVSYWSGERWFSGDPLTGQLPVDVTHIALMFGDVDKHLNVISYLGKLKFEVM
jgi:hypothetical protein